MARELHPASTTSTGRIPIMDVTPQVEGGRYPAKSAVGEPFEVTALVFREGHDLFGADVVLMNPQYTPQVFTKHDVEGMVHLLDVTAKETSVDLFQRFALMRYWQLTEGMPFSAFTSPDDLHMNDWGYGCVAKLLAGAIYDAATRPTLTATVNRRR